ncbi:hypothetical protein JW933_07270 [candidate division FCPU426 bacterium]|nr:hypothetical protein [candidate division FCPU426 bacterium]
MFASWKNIGFFLIGLVLTMGLLLTPHLVPGGWGYQMGLSWSLAQISAVLIAGLAILAVTLWSAGRLMRDAKSWKEPRVIIAAVAIALIANTLYMFLIEWFGLHSGWRALIAVLGVPVIYGNLARVLGRISLAAAMANIFTGALATMGAGFILAVLIRGW